MPEFYETENIVNFRELGGYACGNTVTKSGFAFRCGMPRMPGEKDKALLKSLGIKIVIDLRGDKEAEEMPSVFIDDGDFDYYHFNLLEANPALNDIALPIWNMYTMSLNNYGENYAEVLRLIIRIDRPFLFHCFLGKDRTGLLAAVILGAAGVSEEDIISDYELSYTYLKPFLDREISENTGLIWEQDRSRLRSDRENMKNLLDILNESYGGIKGYLKYIGLSDDEIAALALKLRK